VQKSAKWKRARTGLLPAITGISLYVFLPSLLSVASSWRALEHVDWPFALLVLACEAASFVLSLGTRPDRSEDACLVPGPQRPS